MRKSYPSDLTDQQWLFIEHLFPQSTRGRPKTVPSREIVNAILYVMKNGCAWRALPHDFPVWQTVFIQRLRWARNGVLTRLQELLITQIVPTTCIIDSTFIESSYGGGAAAPSGYKRATGHSIHVLLDKTQHPLQVTVLPANVHDAHGARVCIPVAKKQHPSLTHVLGDKAYRQKPLYADILQVGVVLDGDSPPLPKGVIFVPMPLRWRVEQFFSWLVKWRRVAKNWCFTQYGFSLDVAWSLCGLVLTRRLKALAK